MEAIAAVIKTVFGWPARYYLTLGLACVALLWLSASPWAGTLGLSTLPSLVRLGLTLAVVACAALWLAKASYVGQRWLALPFQRRRVRLHVLNLNADEQTILLWHVLRDNRTVNIDFHHQVAHGLRAKGILEYAGGTGKALATPHFISVTAWNALQDKLEAVPLSQDDKDALLQMSEYDLYQRVNPMGRQLGFGYR